MAGSVTSSSGVPLDEMLRSFNDVVSKNILAGMNLGADSLLDELSDTSPRGATKSLANSWSKEIAIKPPGQVIGEVGSPVEHAIDVEVGTSPHEVALQPLLEWVVYGPIREKNISVATGIAIAVRHKIAAKGTDGQYILKNALSKKQDEITRQINLSVEQALQEMAHGK